tara:strand:- start:722 stop:1921 length:1200 start_codon:yes stop_codon:yes gene_type:complete
MKNLNPFNLKNFIKTNYFLPYSKQNITGRDIKSVVKALKNDLITQGEILPRFENEISKKVLSDYSIAVNSATSALHIACLALGLKENDYLWTTPITFVASANCGKYCGAKVDFVDIEPNTGLISIKALEEKLKKAKNENKLPKIIVPVHLCGSSCDMQKIFELSNIYGFSIIEDASHAIGGRYQDFPVGCCKYSDITVFSFHPVKIITSAEGGVAVTNNHNLAEKMRDLRSHCIIRDPKRFKEKSLGLWKYEIQELGYNYRMNELQAALGLSQLKRLEKIINRRNYLYDQYKILLDTLPLKLLDIPKNVYSSLHLAVITLNDETRRENVFSLFRKNNIGVQLHYYPVHLQPIYKKLGFKEGDFPSSEEYSKKAISIPLYPQLKKRDLIRVANLLKKFLD